MSPTIRDAFPALKPDIHLLDNAATAQMPGVVAQAMAAFQSGLRGNVRRGVHPLAEQADDALAGARVTVARFLSAAAEEIVFTPGCTASLNLAARAIVSRLEPGDEIVVSRNEHHSHWLPWHSLAGEKCLTVKTIPVDREGRLDLTRLDRLIGPRTRAVAVTLASNVTGAITNLAPIAAAARAHGALVVVDAAQRAPHGPMDVTSLGADLLAFAGHKTFGPTGIGVLWGRSEVLADLPPVTLGGGMVASVAEEGFTALPPPARFEAGTLPIAQAVGLAAALEWMMGLDWAAIAAAERELVRNLLAGLETLEGVRLVGPPEEEGRVPLVSFTVPGCHPHDIAHLLGQRQVMVRAGHHCAKPLMDALGLADGTVRASLAPYNDQADIDALLDGLAEAMRVLR